MRKMFRWVVIALMGVIPVAACTSEADYCRAYCQRAGECEQCGGVVAIDECVDECKALDTDTQKKLVDCYKGECENIYICDQIIGTTRPSPCY